MAAHQKQKVTIVADFISDEAPGFHRAFGDPSTSLNPSTMQYEQAAICDLKETLEYHQLAGKYVDFTPDLTKCTWRDVHEELRKAKAKAVESERRGKGPIKKFWRAMGSTSSILAPGLAAIPDHLCVLQGGLAVIFSLARHSEMNRLKILAAFEKVPNIIEMARNKAETFPLDSMNPKSIMLHKNVQELQTTLLQTLPALINRLIPGTFRNAWKSPFREWKIDELLDTVSRCAESVRTAAEALIEELIAGNYEASMNIKAQLDEVLRSQRAMQMSIDAAHGKTHLLHFLMEQLNFNAMGILPGRDPADMSEMGTALPGYTPEDLLRVIDVNHLRGSHDAMIVVRRSETLNQADIERAAHMIVAPQVKELMSTAGSNIIAVNGHFDPSQMGKISPLSIVCAMLSEALRQKPQQYSSSFGPGPPMSPNPERGTSSTVVLEYFCALHTADDDDLRGPQGLIRCLTAQLILALVANGWIGPAEAVDLPYLRDGEEELLGQQHLDAICRLFTSLMALVPKGAVIYGVVDGWSAYEREELWSADYELVLSAFRDATGATNQGGGAEFKLLLTSPTSCRWLGDVLMPGQIVSLRNCHVNGGGWTSVIKRGLRGLTRADTMPESRSKIGEDGFEIDEHGGQPWIGHDRRSST